VAPNGKTLAGETTNVRACVARDPARVKVWSARPERWLAPRALNRWNEEDHDETLLSSALAIGLAFNRDCGG